MSDSKEEKKKTVQEILDGFLQDFVKADDDRENALAEHLNSVQKSFSAYKKLMGARVDVQGQSIKALQARVVELEKQLQDAQAKPAAPASVPVAASAPAQAPTPASASS